MNAFPNSPKTRTRSRRAERGFTLIELAIATVVLLVGVVAVMQLVPNAMQANLRNRQDTSSAVVAQRMRDVIAAQKLDAVQIVDPTGSLPRPNPATLAPCPFGDPARNDVVVGATVRRVLSPNGRVVDLQIDFNGAVEQGYSFNYADPNDPARTLYELRYAVVTSVRTVGSRPGQIVTKRVVIGVRRSNDPSYSVSFSTLVVR